MSKTIFAYVKTKTQISFMVTGKLISTFVFATRTVQVQSLYFLNPKFLAIFCGCTAWFVSDLVGNPEDQFSRNEAQTIWLYCLASSAPPSVVWQVMQVAYVQGSKNPGIKP